jgi:hypothetical protein
MADTYSHDFHIAGEGPEDPDYRRDTPERLRSIIDLMRDGKTGRAKRELLEMEPRNESERRERDYLLTRVGHDVDGLERFLNSGASNAKIDLARESMGNDHYHGQKPGLFTPREIGKLAAAIIAIGLVVGTCVARGDSGYEPKEPAPIYETAD